MIICNVLKSVMKAGGDVRQSSEYTSESPLQDFEGFFETLQSSLKIIWTWCFCDTEAETQD